jgi:prepilin-type N-terminal cleavage/methylation domain-containing protein
MQPHSTKSGFKSRRGYSIIEILVVIAVIGALAVIGLVSLNRSREKARDAHRRQDLATIRTALLTYYDDNGFSYPDTVGGAGEPDQSSLNQGIFNSDEALNPIFDEFLSKVLTPPSTDPVFQYWYDANDTQSEYIVYTHLEGTGTPWYWIGSDGNGTELDATTHNPVNCEGDETCTW